MPLTPDAIPTNEQLRESIADRFYQPHRKQIWGGVILFFLIVVGILGYRQIQRSRQDEMWDRYHEAAQTFELNPFVDPDAAAARKQLEAMQQIVRDYPDDTVTPFAMQAIIKAQIGLGEYEGSLKTLDELRTRFKDFPLNTLPADPDDAGHPRSLAQRVEDAIKRERDWAGKRAYVHHWPAEDRLALVETTSGNMWW